MTLLEHKQYSQSNYQPKEQLDTTQQTSSVPCSGKTKFKRHADSSTNLFELS